MRLILHIGTHKTGTTSIQKFCAQHRRVLRKAGLWYPDYDLIGGEGHYAHHHLANAMAGLPTSRGGLDAAAAFFRAVRKRAGADETVLISAETLWRHVLPPVELSGNEYEVAGSDEAYWKNRRAFVARVAELAGTSDVQIVAVLRRQDSFAESMFKERVKGTAYAHSFERFVDAFRHRFRYFDQLSVWNEYFPAVKVLIYEDLCAEPDLVRAFFAALGLDVKPESEPAARRNISLSNDLIAYKQVLNRSGLSDDALYEIALAMQDSSFADGLGLDQGSTLWRSQEERCIFLSRFRRQDLDVCRKFTTLERDELFPPGGPECEPAYRGLSPETEHTIRARIKNLRASH